MLDVYKAQFNTKGGMVWGAWDTVIITTNVHPSQWYDDKVDPWGIEDRSPLRRRIDFLLEFTGVWPTSMVSVNGEKPTATTWLHNRAATEAARAELVGDGFLDHEVLGDAQGNHDEPSNPPAAPTQHSPTVEELIEEWEMVDQALSNDFIGRWGPRSPLRFDRSAEGERALLEGEQGDGLADNGRDLFGFTG